MPTQSLHQGSLRPADVLPHPGLQVHSIAAPRSDRRLSFLMSAAIYCAIAGGLALVAKTAPVILNPPIPPHWDVQLWEPPVQVRTSPEPAAAGAKGDSSRPANIVPVLPQPPANPDLTPDALPTQDLSHAGLFDPALPIGPGPGTNAISGDAHSGTGSAVSGPTSGNPVEVSFAAVHVLQQIQPVYSNLARLSHKEGDVVLMMTINEHGVPTNVQMDSGDTIFKHDAIRAAQQWRFTPAQINGQPHAARFKLVLQFRLR